MQVQDTSGSSAGQASSVGRFVVTSIVEGVAEDVDTFFRYIGGIVDHFRLKFASHGSVGPLPSDDDRSRLPLLPPFRAPDGSYPPGVLLDLSQDGQGVSGDAQLASAPVAASGSGDHPDDPAHDAGDNRSSAIVGTAPQQVDGRTDGAPTDQTGEAADKSGSVNNAINVTGDLVGQGVYTPSVEFQGSSRETASPVVSAGPTRDEIDRVIDDARRALYAMDRLVKSAPEHLREDVERALDRVFGERIPDGSAGVPAGADAPPAEPPGPAPQPPEVSARPR